MLLPIHSTIDNGNGSARRQTIIVGSVIALHALLGYAIVTGLAQRIVLEAPHLLSAEVLPRKEIPQPPPPPPTMPELARPTVPAVPVPVIRIARVPVQPSRSITVVHGQPAAPPAPRPVVARPAPAPAPTPPRSVAGTHTSPPYPMLARRLGESGTVRLEIALDKTGAVSAVSVATSSGHERLDQAAVDWVRAYWRYKPATRDGQAVASSVLAEVVFDLRNAR